MQIKKYYKFYYGHRNQDLKGTKCNNPHGHIGQVYCVFNVKRNGNISTLFDDFDSKLDKLFKEEFDHRTLIDVNDPLLDYILRYEQDTGDKLGMKILPFPSSVENVCFYLFHIIYIKFGFNLDRLEFQETTTSTIIYTLEDYHIDYNSDLGIKLLNFKNLL